MNKNILIDIKEQLHKYGFEVQTTSFNDIVKTGEINCLQKDTLPKCDAVSLLKSFPDFFIIHKTEPPKSGIFFVKGVDSNNDLNAEIKAIYKKYFPERLIIINQNKSSELIAKWFHNDNPPIPLNLFLKNEMGK